MQPIVQLEDIKPELALKRLYGALSGAGAILLSGSENSRPNPMTIGWATLGFVWQKPVMTVYVRPSRYSYGLMQEHWRFSVSVPAAGELKRALELCGSKSGRDMDKLGAAGLKSAPGREKGVFIVEGCSLYFECATAAVSHITPEALSPEIKSQLYPDGDYHAVYHGVILQCYGKPL